MLIAQQAHYVATLEPTRRIDVAHVGARAERAMIADRSKHEQTLAHIRTLGRHAQRLAEPVALGTKLYQGLAADFANPTPDQNNRNIPDGMAETLTARDGERDSAADVVGVIGNVAKRKPASTISGEQSDRQLSPGASRQTGP
jgi:hypothetical protein